MVTSATHTSISKVPCNAAAGVTGVGKQSRNVVKELGMESIYSVTPIMYKFA